MLCPLAHDVGREPQIRAFIIEQTDGPSYIRAYVYGPATNSTPYKHIDTQIQILVTLQQWLFPVIHSTFDQTGLVHFDNYKRDSLLNSKMKTGNEISEKNSFPYHVLPLKLIKTETRTPYCSGLYFRCVESERERGDAGVAVSRITTLLCVCVCA